MQSLFKKIIVCLSAFLVLGLLPIKNTYKTARSFTSINIDYYEIIFIIVLFKLFKILIDEVNEETR